MELKTRREASTKMIRYHLTAVGVRIKKSRALVTNYKQPL